MGQHPAPQGRQDAKRGKMFTKLIKEITVAAKMGGSDADTNPRLRLAMDKAFDINMSKDTVERAIKRGAGELDGASYEEIRYEGYGTGGVAVMVDCLTDNKTRTVAEVHMFRQAGKAILEQQIPELWTASDLSMAMDMSLEQIAAYVPDILTEAKLHAINEDLATMRG